MINLLFAIHNHQPVGNFGHVFTKAFKDCYWPLIETLSEFPKICISLHHSGSLLEWADENEKGYIPALVKLVKSGQIEPLGGGFYEPILAVIPPEDAAGQIKMMQDFWKEMSGITPKGIWTTERIWEPSLTTLLSESGIKYTILDDEHFRAGGVTDPTILNYYLNERHGKTIAIFPSDKTLRYKIPFSAPEEVVSHILSLNKDGFTTSVTYGDDGEKFGLWPGTHDWVVKNKWLKNFFKLLVENSDRINVMTMSEHLSSSKPNGTAYLPTCSYQEMGEWVMPAASIRRYDGVKQFLKTSGKWDEASPFMRGGYWDNFLTKYPESNYMHKKMLYVSKKLESLRAPAKRSSSFNWKYWIASSENGLAMTEATRHLYKAQCNCAYWHGMFGGLYLNYLRYAIYKNLIEAENIVDTLKGEKNTTKIELADIDCDHNNEIILSNAKIIAVAKPSSGAGLMELSHRVSGLNLQDVMARREEAYHKKESAAHADDLDEGIASIHNIKKDLPTTDRIIYDKCNRYSFLDRIWGNSTSFTDPSKSLYKVDYSVSAQDKKSITLSGKSGGLQIFKTFTLNDNTLAVKYGLLWDDSLKKEIRFGTTLNLTMLAGHDDERYFLLPSGEKEFLDAEGILEGMDALAMVDEYHNLRLNISMDKKMDLFRYPVNTLSQSESGFDLLYQGSCILCSFIVPAGTREYEFGINLTFDNAKKES